MPNFLNVESEFLDKVIETIEVNLADEDFGVSELAESLGMSRSNLLRRVQKLVDVSASVLIRQVRLHHAQEMLRGDDITASEVSYKVGFNSVSYFTKCYREQYGYPPGEELKHFKAALSEAVAVASERPPRSSWLPWLVSASVVLVMVLVVIFYPKSKSESQYLEKSIAVLPFKNDSADSSNVYIINGLMEAVLNNLQKIEDLRVISRTSVEAYRNNSKSISQIAKELNVDYVLEGSGQKVGDQVRLTIQLIEAPKDDHLWSQQYNRATSNIFDLQSEVAKDIANEIEVYISPDEIRRIEKLPTENALAYDYFLRGLSIMNKLFGADLGEALVYFEKSVEEDPNFALGYAHMAICYYYLDLYATEKQFVKEISELSDRAVFLDPELFASQVAKGLFYMQDRQYTLAIEYFEKALVYSPNSVSAHNFLSEIYSVHLPNTRRYLTHALNALRLDNTNTDSTLTSISFLHLSNALAQTGFFEEAAIFADRSISLDSTNLFPQYLYAYIKMAQGNDLQTTVDLIKDVLKKDTTRIDIIQEVAKLYYVMERYEEASFYYDVFTTIKSEYGLNIFDAEAIKIAYIYDQLGREEEAREQMKTYYAYAENDNSIYKDLMFSSYHAYMGDTEEAMTYLKKFSEQRGYFYWLVMLMRDDPIMKPLQAHPDYEQTMKKIDDQFWEDHNEIRKMLEKEGLLKHTSLRKASSY